ncbi:MAG TPA: hypothetical protein VIL36_06640 [Acidimicrobiales bacterium]
MHVDDSPDDPAPAPAPAPAATRTITTVTQYASPDLIAAIVYDGHDPADDPRWPESGAPSRADYGRWCGEWCGMACLRMVLTLRDGTAPPLYELLTAGLPYGTYVPQPDGSIRGLYHRPFADYVRAEHGLEAEVHGDLDADDLRALLADADADGDDPGGTTVVIASVHREIRRPDRPAPGRGGHLVLVTGHDPAADTLTFHNPSGHTPAARTATLPTDVFEPFWSHRAIGVRLR